MGIQGMGMGGGVYNGIPLSPTKIYRCQEVCTVYTNDDE